METPRDAESLARLWIEKWNEGRPEEIPLAEGFRHASPYGVIEGRQVYMDAVKPMAEASVTSLEIRRTVGGEADAAVWYRMTTGGVDVECCDWIQAEGGEITAITAFYDATELR